MEERVFNLNHLTPKQNRMIRYVDGSNNKPFETYIPSYGGETINRLRQLAAQNNKEEQVLVLKGLDAPSAINALRLYLYDYDEQAKVEIQLAQDAIVPESAPIISSGVVFWQYDRTYQQTPAVHRPRNKVKDLVVKLARMKYDCTKWYEMAGILAQQLKNSDAEDLYGIMVYPPKPEENVLADRWLQYIQFAAVFLLARLEELQQPAQGLIDICFGQIDWPIVPAMVVLAYESQLYPECQVMVKAIFSKLMERMDSRSYCFFEQPFVQNFLKVPNLEEPLRQKLEMWHEQFVEKMS